MLRCLALDLASSIDLCVSTLWIRCFASNVSTSADRGGSVVLGESTFFRHQTLRQCLPAWCPGSLRDIDTWPFFVPRSASSSPSHGAQGASGAGQQEVDWMRVRWTVEEQSSFPTESGLSTGSATGCSASAVGDGPSKAPVVLVDAS